MLLARYDFMQKLPCYPDVQLLIIMHLFAKIGFAANEAATSLKMVEKGLKREDLAMVALTNFPFANNGWMAGCTVVNL